MKSIFAMPAEAMAMPVNPSTPAINATTRKTNAQVQHKVLLLIDLDSSEILPKG